MRSTRMWSALSLRLAGHSSAILFLLLPVGCAYFNTFYNAHTYYDSGLKLLETGGTTGAETIPRPANEAFGKAIEKAHKVIEEYPDSRFVDDAFFILGRSHFYRREYGLAERYLRQLLEEYPWSPFADEVRIWLAKVHAQLGLNEAVEEDLAPILAMEDPPREFITEIYILRGETALREGRFEQALLAFREAAESAVEASQEAAIYYRLYSLVNELGDYENALVFLDRYSRTTPSESERINSRLLRVQLLQKMDDFEGAYREIRNMVALTEFASIIPGLQLELGKIEYVRGDKNEALNRFIDVLEEYGNLPEGSEAAFHAGDIYLTDFHEIQDAEAQFKRVKRNTTYYQPAQARLRQINTIKSVTQTMNSLRSQLGLESEQAIENGDRDTPPGADRISGGEKRVEPATVDSSVAAIDTAKVRDELAYAMFRYGEILLFEMSDSTGSQEIMADIVLNFDRTEVAPQAAYVLYVTASGRPDQAEFWRSIIIEKYSNSPYGLLINDQRTDTGNPQLDSLVSLANTAVPGQPYRALQLFREIQSQYSTEHSFFAIAYLYDEYIAQLDSAITAYDEYLSLYPTGTYTEFARNRYDFLQGIKVGQPLSPAAAGTSIESRQDQSRTTETPAEPGISPEDSSSYEESPSDMDEASPEQESVKP